MIALTCVCIIEARGQTKFFFIFYRIRDVFRIEGILKVFIFGAWVMFLEETNISEVFKIVSRGDDKR